MALTSFSSLKDLLKQNENGYRLNPRQRISLERLVAELLVADPLRGDDLLLVAVLPVRLLTSLLRLVVTARPHHLNTVRDEFLLLHGVTELPWDRCTVLSVAVTLSLPGSAPRLQPANLLGLEVAVLLLERQREGVRELLAVTLSLGPTQLITDSPRGVVAVLPGDPLAHSLLAVSTVNTLLLTTLELHGLLTSHIIEDRLGILAVLVLQVSALEVIPGVDVDLEGCIADSLLDGGTHLHHVLLLQGEVVHLLLESTHQLFNIEAFPVSFTLDDTGTIRERLHDTRLLDLRVTSLLHVRHALVHELNLLLVMTLNSVLAVTVIVGRELQLIRVR